MILDGFRTSRHPGLLLANKSNISLRHKFTTLKKVYLKRSDSLIHKNASHLFVEAFIIEQ